MICAHCGHRVRGSASYNGLPLCHPDEGMDCYHLVTVWGHKMPCDPCVVPEWLVEQLEWAAEQPPVMCSRCQRGEPHEHHVWDQAVGREGYSCTCAGTVASPDHASHCDLYGLRLVTAED